MKKFVDERWVFIPDKPNKIISLDLGFLNYEKLYELDEIKPIWDHQQNSSLNKLIVIWDTEIDQNYTLHCVSEVETD